MRTEKLQEGLASLNADAAIFYSLGMEYNKNIYYFSGYTGAGLLVVPARKEPFLIAPEMELEKAQRTGMKAYMAEKKKRLFETLASILRRRRLVLKKTGIDKENYNLLVYERIRKTMKSHYVNVDEVCKKIRMSKDSYEISCIRKACAVTDSVFSKITGRFAFRAESELKSFIKQEIIRMGCDLAFDPIVASGPHGSNPHFDREGPIRKGFLVLDFGARYRGYCSDMTRTIYVGSPSERERKDYALVLNAQESVIRGIGKGRKFSDLYQEAVDMLGDKAKYFTHALGHGIGLDIHEMPGLSPDEKLEVGNGIAFTVEPGIYYPGKYGIRIEDSLLFMNSRPEILTKSEKKLIEVHNEI